LIKGTTAFNVKIDRIIQTLLPHDEKFYKLFEESTKLLLKASVTLRKTADADEIQIRNLAKEIEHLEHQADEVTHSIYGELNATFVTPFDREDIHELASSLDDIMDFINGSASRLALYNVKADSQYMRKLMEIIEKQVEVIGKGILYLRDFKDSSSLQEVLKKVNEYENEADSVFEFAVADLFDNEKNVIELIKKKEILVGLETATDKCEDVANVLESILIKHA
jgi:predicted phosphate transport protein (TIGR00153 family)